MIGTSHVTAAARFIRVCTMTSAAVMLVAFVSVQAFASQYNETPTAQTVVARPPTNSELAAAIVEQTSRGLTCREEPAITDTILFQALEETEVRVLTFEEAIAASSARTGWIRRYCF